MNQSSIFAHQTIPRHRLDALCEEGNEEPRASCQRDIEIARDNICLLAEAEAKKKNRFICEDWPGMTLTAKLRQSIGARVVVLGREPNQCRKPHRSRTAKSKIQGDMLKNGFQSLQRNV